MDSYLHSTAYLQYNILLALAPTRPGTLVVRRINHNFSRLYLVSDNAGGTSSCWPLTRPLYQDVIAYMVRGTFDPCCHAAIAVPSAPVQLHPVKPVAATDNQYRNGHRLIADDPNSPASASRLKDVRQPRLSGRFAAHDQRL